MISSTYHTDTAVDGSRPRTIDHGGKGYAAATKTEVCTSSSQGEAGPFPGCGFCHLPRFPRTSLACRELRGDALRSTTPKQFVHLSDPFIVCIRIQPKATNGALLPAFTTPYGISRIKTLVCGGNATRELARVQHSCRSSASASAGTAVYLCTLAPASHNLDESHGNSFSGPVPHLGASLFVPLFMFCIATVHRSWLWRNLSCGGASCPRSC